MDQEVEYDLIDIQEIPSFEDYIIVADRAPRVAGPREIVTSLPAFNFEGDQ